jgi:hypothetical protein
MLVIVIYICSGLCAWEAGLGYVYRFESNATVIADDGSVWSPQFMSCVSSLICLSTDSFGSHFELKLSEFRMVQRDKEGRVISENMTDKFQKVLFLLSSFEDIFFSKFWKRCCSLSQRMGR